MTPQTDLVIDGFQSSANTFSFNKFRDYLEKGIKIAHHLHHPGQFLIALRLNVPCVVLIRNPIEVIPSVVIRFPQKNISQYFTEYLNFYEAILPYRKAFFIADFSRITNDFPKVIEDFDKFYGDKIEIIYSGEKRDDEFILEQMEDNVRKRLKEFDSDKPSVPNEERNKKKEKVKAIIMSEEYQDERERALNLYNAFLKG